MIFEKIFGLKIMVCCLKQHMNNKRLVEEKEALKL